VGAEGDHGPASEDGRFDGAITVGEGLGVRNDPDVVADLERQQMELPDVGDLPRMVLSCWPMSSQLLAMSLILFSSFSHRRAASAWPRDLAARRVGGRPSVSVARQWLHEGGMSAPRQLDDHRQSRNHRRSMTKHPSPPHPTPQTTGNSKPLPNIP